MSWSELVTTAAALAAAFVVSLGGGGAIVLGLSNWIGKIFADRYAERMKHELQQEIEGYKTRLRKSEFLFQKEFDAASQFIALRQSLVPRYRFRDMDWGDACEDFASDFTKVENALKQYTATHGAALKQIVLDRLSSATEKVARGKFEVSKDGVSTEGMELAEKVMEELEEVEKELCAAVWSQSSA
jgi:hypothetical protein